MPKFTEIEVCYMNDRLTSATRYCEVATHFDSLSVRRARVYPQSRRTDVVVRHLDGARSNTCECTIDVYEDVISREVFS